MKKLIAVFSVCALLLCSCMGREPAESENHVSTPAAQAVPDGVFSDFDMETGEGPSPVFVQFKGTDAEIKGDGAELSDNALKITVAGTYVLTGFFSGGIVVEAAKEDDVHLIFNGVNISCENSAAVNGISSDKIVITLADGTENTVSDGFSYCAEKGDEPNACIFSDDDMTVNGGGSLSVVGNCNNGIGTKNDLRIVSGSITVTASKNALKGNDSVVIGGGELILQGGKDAVKSDNNTDPERGFVAVYGGNLDIEASDDGIQAVTSIKIAGGKVAISASDNSLNCDGTLDVDESCLIIK